MAGIEKQDTVAEIIYICHVISVLTNTVENGFLLHNRYLSQQDSVARKLTNFTDICNEL